MERFILVKNRLCRAPWFSSFAFHLLLSFIVIIIIPHSPNSASIYYLHFFRERLSPIAESGESGLAMLLPSALPINHRG